MEHLTELLKDLELLTFRDISTIPEEQQHDVAEQIERLQDSLQSIISHYVETSRTISQSDRS